MSAAATWDLNSLERIGGHAVKVIGSPKIVRDQQGSAIRFDGVGDGLIVDANPMQGLERFTIEVVFSPDADGPEEQRFFHVAEAGSDNRALVELRMLPGSRFALDTYLRHGDAQLTLLDRAKTHPAGEWHVAALTFDGRTMMHYVDGVAEGSGVVAFRALREGQTAIGMRQNRVSFFKGRIRTVRVTPEVLAPRALLKAGPERAHGWM